MIKGFCGLKGIELSDGEVVFKCQRRQDNGAPCSHLELVYFRRGSKKRANSNSNGNHGSGLVNRSGHIFSQEIGERRSNERGKDGNI